MTRLYLITDEHDRTNDGRYWLPGATHHVSGKGGLFGSGWFQCYMNPLFAAFLSPISDCPENPHLWLVQGKVEITQKGLIVGCRKLTAMRQVPLPILSNDQRIELAIAASKNAYPEEFFVSWADRQLQPIQGRRKASEGRCGTPSPSKRPKRTLHACGSRDHVFSGEATEAAFWAAAALISSKRAPFWVPSLAATAATKAAAASDVSMTSLLQKVLKGGN